MSEQAGPFDLRWLRGTITAIAAIGLCASPFSVSGIPLFIPGAIALGMLLCLYFGHILLLRLQCGLFEFLVVTMFLGLVVGLLVSTPGALQVGLVFTPLVAAWVLYSATLGLVHARLWNAGTLGRLLLIFAALWGTASAPLMVVGVVVCIAHFRMPGLADFAPWGYAMFALGLVGIVFDFILGMRAKRQSRELIANYDNESSVRRAAKTQPEL